MPFKMKWPIDTSMVIEQRRFLGLHVVVNRHKTTVSIESIPPTARLSRSLGLTSPSASHAPTTAMWVKLDNHYTLE